MKKKVIIIGAGPGGLAAGMVLANRGYETIIYEKQNFIGGRCSPINIDGFTFELGPTFVMLPQIFEDIFKLCGKNINDYLKLKRLNTLYRLHFKDHQDFHVYFDKKKLKQEIARLFPGDELGYEKYLEREKNKFDRMFPCLTVPYIKWYHYFRPKLLRALPSMDIFNSVHGVLKKYFKNEDMIMSMSFQSKYLGMSPWDCPGSFSILSYVEHAFGIYHPIGGVHKITEAMAKVVQESGGKIHLNSEVAGLIIEEGKIKGVSLANGQTDLADTVVLNGDFAAAMTKLVPEQYRPQWSNASLKTRPYSCSTFMIYLGLSKKFDFEHHNLFFADDYKKNVDQIFKNQTLPQDPSFYIQNASATDSTLAPEGKSTIYALVPVPNLDAKIDWHTEKKKYRDLVIEKIKQKTELKDIEKYIEVERVITPQDWQDKMGVYKGAVFNLAHNLTQMLYLRPHNEFESLPGLYIVGGGTHPGSGLPTIVESGRITADLITNKK